jgi:hypothetical protein
MAPDSPPSHWYDNPPDANGRKVVITDTDHYAPGQGDSLWVWKSFVRGHHPILMDFGIIMGVNPPDPSAGSPGVPPYNAYEAARYAMGDTLRYAEKMDLIKMEPRGDLASTGYALASPGNEYLVLQPNDTMDSFKIKLESGTYLVEWFDISARETKSEENVPVRRKGDKRFTPPFSGAGPSVLYLKRAKP